MTEIKQESPSSKSSAVSQLDSGGRITLDLSITADQLILGDKLGQGGFGVVHKAKWGNKQVALKQLLITSPTEQEKAEFKREAATMFQIGADSEHVVRLYKIMLQPLSLVMELMPKGTLYELLALHRDKPLEWEKRYRLAMDISTGLADIHRHGVLHRDLKSLNVLLGDGLRAKLTDFGLASVKTSSSRHSNAKGTPHWMAPEVVVGGKTTESSDVYSLGMILWELATHRQPYAELENSMQVMFQIAQGKQETIPDDCPSDFKKLIMDCWLPAAKRPKAVQVSTLLQPLLENKAEPEISGLVSLSLSSVPHYHPQSFFHSTSVETKAVKSPAPLASAELQSSLHYQPQATETLESKSSEEKSISSAKSFQTGLKLYGLAQYQKAFPYFQQAAKDNYPPAFVYLGTIYEYGNGVATDLEKSANYFSQAQAHESWFIEQAKTSKAEAEWCLGHYYACAKKNAEEAVVWYRRAADKRYPWAQYHLGMCYLGGLGVSRDLEYGVAWITLAAVQENEDARSFLALCNSTGHGMAKNQDEAFRCELIAAKNGHAEAQCRLGESYEYGYLDLSKDYTQAMIWYRRAAENGSADAQEKLGWCFENGHHVAKKDYVQAATWYRRAAEQGSASARNSLGECFDKGQGVAQNHTEAVFWYRLAAQQENASAQNNLGWCYYKGNGVTKDLEQAKYWYEKAAANYNESAKNNLIRLSADQGDATAQLSLAKQYEKGEGKESRDYIEATKWCALAAAQGDKEAQYKLSCYYKLGLGVEKKFDQAKAWCEKAAKQNLPQAKNDLEHYLLLEKITTPSEVKEEKPLPGAELFQSGLNYYEKCLYQKALPYFQKAAKQNYQPAYLWLGRMYKFGLAVAENTAKAEKFFEKTERNEWFEARARAADPAAQYHYGTYFNFVRKNYGQAFYWYLQAAKQGHTGAQYCLAISYAYGEGTSIDEGFATFWAQLAAEKGNTPAQVFLGQRYAHGTGVPVDPVQALAWLNRAAEQGDAGAQIRLASIYQKSNKSYGVTSSNYSLALKWYLQAAEQGSAEAQYKLGCFYEQDYGSDKNLSQAKEWFKKAKAQGYELAKEGLERIEASKQLERLMNDNPFSLWSSSISTKKPENKPAPKSFFQSLFSN